MSDDLVALNVLVVSDETSERDALKNAAAQASVMIDVAEIDGIGKSSAACNLLARRNVDVIFLDSRMPHDGRQAIIDAARAAEAKPLVVSIGSVDLTSSQISRGWPLTASLPNRSNGGGGSSPRRRVRARLPNRVLVVDHSPTVPRSSARCCSPAATSLRSKRQRNALMAGCSVWRSQSELEPPIGY